MLRFLTSLAVLVSLLVMPPALLAQQAEQPAYLNMKVAADAKVYIGDHLTRQTGELRNLVTPPLPVSATKQYSYVLKATFKGKDGKDVTVEKAVQVIPGKTTEVDLTKPTPTNKPKTNDNPSPAAATVPASRSYSDADGRPLIPSFSAGDGLSYDQRYDPSYRPAVGDHYVQGYYRSDGTYVRGYMQTNRDGSFWNNYSSSGNVNPYTGQVGTKQPPTRPGGPTRGR